MTPHPPALNGTDHAKIVALTSLYAHCLDRHDWVGLARVFAPGATMEFAGLPAATGPDAIGTVCAGALEPLAASQHLIGSPLVETTGGTVTVSSYFQAQHVKVLDGREALFTIAGTYVDQVERRPEGWRISLRRQSVTWQAGDPRVLY